MSEILPHEFHFKAKIVPNPLLIKVCAHRHVALHQHGSTSREALSHMSNFATDSPLEDKKCHQFLMSRPRVTDLFLQDVNHDKETGCTRLCKVRRGGLWGLWQQCNRG